MPELQGLSLIGSGRGTPEAKTFWARDPATGEALPPAYHAAGPAEVERACLLAHEAFETYGQVGPDERAAFLGAVAEGLEATGEAIVDREGNRAAPCLLRAEHGRTCHQLRLFAKVVLEGSWVDARIDTTDPECRPAPKPDVRSMRRPLGPVAVFGSSNFPLAFSVAGGDSASALAAGNPVIFKAHPAHPRTGELVGQVIAAGVRQRRLPEGVFSLLFDGAFDAGQAPVRQPLVRAVAFTGSRAGGEALLRLAATRPQPIPVYAEMGSVNPVVVLPGALGERARSIAEGLHASFTLGVGQFCTNPGVVLVEAGPAGHSFVERLAELTRATAAGPMLTPSISVRYEQGLERLHRLGATLVAEGQTGAFAATGRATVWEVEAGRAQEERGLLDEVFGPSTLVVRYSDAGELERFVRSQEGNLTASLHALSEEIPSGRWLVPLLTRTSGRVVFNQFPTGVEVNHAMVHGGPFPATSDGRSTSVGTRAIERFSRLVSYQNVPQDALPEDLRDDNPRRIWRLVNGEPTRGPVAT